RAWPLVSGQSLGRHGLAGRWSDEHDPARKLPSLVLDRCHCDPRRDFGLARPDVWRALADAPLDSETDGLGRIVDAALVDRRELQLDGDRQPGAARRSRLALVRFVAVRL